MALVRQVMLWKAPDGIVRSFLGDAITPPPPPPVGTPNANIVLSSKTFLSVTLSSSTSTEGTPGATLTSRSWDFGDGATATGLTATHVYAASGTYTVKLTVVDSLGASNTDSIAVIVTAQATNQAPTAAFTTSMSGLTVSVNGSGSSDPDGSIASYAWKFGDGAAATGVTASHAYAAAGTYTVTLTVTDDKGAASAAVTHTVTAVAPNVPPVVKITSVTNNGMSTTVSGTLSDTDGTITSSTLDWGDGTVTSGLAASFTLSHTYGSIGPWPLTLTGTDNTGVSATATATANPVGAGGGGLAIPTDDGNGTNSGLQVTGTAYVALVSSGSDAGAQATAVGAGKQLSLPVGTSAKLKAWPTASNHAADVTAGGGIIGAGSAKSILSQVVNASTGTSTESGTTANELMRVTAAGSTFQDFQLLGTAQGSIRTHHGMDITANDVNVRRVKFKAAGWGDDKAPPGETFALSVYGVSRMGVYDDIEIDGNQHGGSGFGTNGGGADSTGGKAIGDYTVNRLWSHGNWYSACIALWQQNSIAQFVDCKFDDSRCFWNIERCAGKVILIRPRIGTLKAAPSGDWDPAKYGGNPNTNSTPAAVHIFAEAGAGSWTTSAEANAFRFEIHDPRDINGNPYKAGTTGMPKIGMTLGTAHLGTTSTVIPNLYTKAQNFKCYDANGNDISSSFYA